MSPCAPPCSSAATVAPAPRCRWCSAAAEDHDAAVRVAAMNAAGEMGAPGRTLALAHLADADLDVQLAAARAVIATGRHDARS